MTEFKKGDILTIKASRREKKPSARTKSRIGMHKKTFRFLREDSSVFCLDNRPAILAECLCCKDKWYGWLPLNEIEIEISSVESEGLN